MTVTATVGNSGTPAAGATVTFRITKPNGAVVTATGTTSASGVATYRWRSKKSDPVGAYQVRADATVGGAITGSATAAFTLQ